MSAKWWVLGPDQKPYGPYDLASLEEHARNGRVAGESLVCAEGSQEWVPAGSVPALAPFLSSLPVHGASATSSSRMATAPNGWRPVSLVGPILVTIFCCLIGGIVSIVFTAQANTKAAGGDLAGATAAAGRARTWMWASFGIGLALCVLQMVLFAIGAFAGSGFP